MKYNFMSHKVNHFKVDQWPQSCATTTCTYFQNISAKGNRAPIKQSFPILPSHEALAATNMFSVSMDLPILDISYNGITQYVIFCVWLTSLIIMFSRFIYVIAYIILHSFLWMNNIPLYIYEHTPQFTYPLTCRWTLGFLPPFGYCE